MDEEAAPAQPRPAMSEAVRTASLFARGHRGRRADEQITSSQSGFSSKPANPQLGSASVLESSVRDVQEEYAFIKQMLKDMDSAPRREAIDRFLGVPVVLYRFKAGEINVEAVEEIFVIHLNLMNQRPELRNMLLSSFMLTEYVLRRSANDDDIPVKYANAFLLRDTILQKVYGRQLPAYVFRLRIISMLTTLCSSRMPPCVRARGNHIGKLAGEHFRYLASFLYRM
jgi:hypothetical protein